MENGAITMTPVEETRVAGRRVPTAWEVTLSAKGLDISVAAIYPQSWMGTRIPYWEGPVRFKGSHTGQGYLEMSGY